MKISSSLCLPLPLRLFFITFDYSHLSRWTFHDPLTHNPDLSATTTVFPTYWGYSYILFDCNSNSSRVYLDSNHSLLVSSSVHYGQLQDPSRGQVANCVE